jgi:hypothetical protein
VHISSTPVTQRHEINSALYPKKNLTNKRQPISPPWTGAEIAETVRNTFPDNLIVHRI